LCAEIQMCAYYDCIRPCKHGGNVNDSSA